MLHISSELFFLFLFNNIKYLFILTVFMNIYECLAVILVVTGKISIHQFYISIVKLGFNLLRISATILLKISILRMYAKTNSF